MTPLSIHPYPASLDTAMASVLPAYRLGQKLLETLEKSGTAVMSAEPGAGKSTLLPLSLLETFGSRGRIIMTEPRRLAAVHVAERAAALLGEKAGGRVGYRTRFETRVSDSTVLEVVTEGIAERMICADPTLEGVSAIIFDEFHERSLSSDFSLALVRESRAILRPDLALVIMSATLDGAVAGALGAGKVESPGRMFPVEISYSKTDIPPEGIPDAVCSEIRGIFRSQETDGDILAFLPGEADIRKCIAKLGSSLGGNVDVLPLYGMLPPSEQRKAVAPSPQGRRKVILSTPVAETSLTIDGVTAVVDSGYCRKMVYKGAGGALGHLETVRISADMASQRAGRAGRTRSGVCLRLYTETTFKSMPRFRIPEIVEGDLTTCMLEAAGAGEGALGSMEWITPPPARSVTDASALLRTLGALSQDGKLTPHGKDMLSLPCHPRIAHMLLTAKDRRLGALGCDTAALLEEKDPLAAYEAGCDFTLRLSALRSQRNSGKQALGAMGRILQIAGQYMRILHTQPEGHNPDPFDAGYLLAMAFPERVARQSGGAAGEYLLSRNGEKVWMDIRDPLSAEPWIVCADLSAGGPGATGRIFLACAVNPDELGALESTSEKIAWNHQEGRVAARRDTRIGALVTRTAPLPDVPREKTVEAICEAVRKEGTSLLDFSGEEVGELQRRVAAAAAWHPELGLPDLSTEAVLRRCAEWLPLYVGNASTRAELKKIDMASVLRGMIPYDKTAELDRIAPSHIEVPTGSRIRLEYRLGADAPVLRVRLQECFGMTQTPTVDLGRRPVLMELLSPGFKPVQLTSDLSSFWSGTYFEVRKELRRRYPKHSWPDNPLEAPPTRGVRKKTSMG